MGSGISRWACGLLFASWLALPTGGLRAADEVESYVTDVSDYWSPVIEDAEQVDPELIASELLDGEVTPAQMLAPQRRPTAQVAQREPRTTTRRRSSGLSKVPFMIGDTGSGTCLSIGGLSTFSIEHPTLTCSRLNIAEANSPLPLDRTYVSYRHFHNVTGVRVLTLFDRDYNVDQYTLGSERTFCDGMCSVEMRLPIERRLTSNFGSIVNTLVDPAIVEPFQSGRQNELGNVAGILKVLMYEDCNLAVSAGMGVTVPTARDFTYGYFLNNTFEFDLIDPVGIPELYRELEDFGIEIQNETVYLAPFISWVSKPTSRFFHQGFIQVEVAANPSNVRARGSGQIDFVDTTDPNNPLFIPILSAFTPTTGLSTKLHAQTLLRVNLGCGYIIQDNPNAGFIKQLTGMAEVHYTGTLQDAKLSTIPLEVDPDFLAGTFDEFFTFGNFLNQTDIVNAVFGLSGNIGRDGRTVVTNGIAVPISDGEEKAFDLEYNLQVQRLF